MAGLFFQICLLPCISGLDSDKYVFLIFSSSALAVLTSAWLETFDVLHSLILVAFITGNSSLEPLIEGLYAQIHVNLR